MSQQGLLQQSVRDVTGTAYTWEGDWHALFDLDGIAAGTFNGRMLAWINGFLGTSYDNLPGAQAAMAAEAGASNWSSIGTIDLSGEEEAWLPTDLGVALLAWWNADDLANGVVAAWADRVAALTPIQTTEANKPTKAAASFNSAYAGVTFDGSNDRLTVASTGTLPTGTVSSELHALVSQDLAGAITIERSAFGYGSGGASAARFLARAPVSSVNRSRVSNGTASLTDTVFDFSGPHIVSGRFDAATVYGFFDGRASTPASAANAFATATLSTSIGAAANGVALFWGGVVRHVFVTTVLATGDRQKLEGWMAHDSGLASLLDVSHPYKATPP